MKKRKNYRHINGVPEIFGLSSRVFIQLMAPMMLIVLLVSIVGGLIFGLVGSCLTVGLYFFLLTQIKKYGPHFFRVKIHSLKNPFTLVVRRHSNLFFIKE